MNPLNDEDFLKFIWLALVAFVGGIIGYIRKQAYMDVDKTLPQKLLSCLLAVVTSMFVAYVTYEVCFHLLEQPNISVALGGLASFAGTDALVAFEKMLIKNISNPTEKP